MNNLQHLLEKFAKLVQSPALVKKPILASIHNVSRIQLEEGDINLKESILYITASPSIRNELYMRKRSILKDLERTMGENCPRDIR
ncbi:MAG: hypothetical protein V4519_00300 [Patescibacteria group bacterium]